MKTNTSISRGLPVSIAALLLISPLGAQVRSCPAGFSTIAGTWTFSTEGTSTNLLFFASAGTFTASVGSDIAGNPVGVLNITQTVMANGNVSRMETDSGRYQVNSDCTGALTFYAGSRPLQFDFFLVNPSEMSLVGTNNGDVIKGTARMTAFVPCTPAGIAIVGNWIFSLEDHLVGDASPYPYLVATGSLQVLPNNRVVVTDSAGIAGGNVRMEVSSGFAHVNKVNGICATGYLTFSIAGHPFVIDYFYTNPDRIILSAANGADILIGEARRYGTAD